MKKRSLLSLAILSFAFAVNSFGQWNAMAAMTVARAQHGVIAHPNGLVYVFGGYDAVNSKSILEIYDQATNSWSVGASMPLVGRGFSCALGKDSMIYRFSGNDASSQTTACSKYNATTNTWSAIAPIPTAVWESAAATAPNGNIIVFGGESGMTLTQIYNPTTDTWTSGTPIPVGVEMEGAITGPNGKIYLLGGYSGSVVMGNVQIYDPVLNTWSTGATMTTPRNQFACTLHNNNIYCMGGKTSYGNNQVPFFSTVEIYNTSNGLWSTGTSLPITVGETKACTVNGGINVIGGTNGTYQSTNYRMNINVGIDEVNKITMSLYPNPAKDMLTINLEGNNQNYGVNIYSLTGELVYTLDQKELNGKTSLQVDLSKFAAGAYNVSIVTSQKVYNSKLIVIE